MSTAEVTNITPIKNDTPKSSGDHDEVYTKGFNLTHLERLISDCDDQPAWREKADLAAAYVDGKQFTEEQQAALIDEGMKDVKPTNLVGRVVRSILGQEAKSRTDIKVDADEQEMGDLCDVFNVRLAEAKRETYADQAVSNAYAGQVGPGIGWVEVGRNQDVLEYPYRVKDIHRSQMWWDMRAEDVLLRDARWMVRKRWQDLDEMEAAMPQYKELFKNVSNNWAGFVFDSTMDENMRISTFSLAENRWSNVQRRMDWFDSARRRLKLYEVWYKVPAMAVVLQLAPTRRVVFDQNNPSHIQAVNSGKCQISKGITRQVRMSLFAGPHRLCDYGTARRNFPYIPFIAYRDDEDNSPYGLVEGMIAPQDEYNSRRIRINWLLRSRQIIMDEDALATKANTLNDVVQQINRPDLTVILNPNRTNKSESALRIESNLGLQKEQIDVMQDAKQNIQDVPGVYGSQLGQAASGVTSGIANSLLIEQGATAMGDLNDNYRHSRRLVFESLLDLIVEDHSQVGMQVKIGNGSSRRVVVLNMWDPQTQEIVNNTKDAPLRVGMGEVPSTPAFKLQQQQQISQIITALAPVSPDAAAIMVPGLIEATDQPDRMERADDVRRKLGIPTADDRRAAQAQQVQQTADQARKKAMEDKAILMEMEHKQAEIDGANAKVSLTNAQTDQAESVAALNMAKVTEMGHGMGLARRVADTPPPVEAAPAPDQETPDMAHERMINEAIAEARAARSQGAMQ